MQDQNFIFRLFFLLPLLKDWSQMNYVLILDYNLAPYNCV